MVIDVWVDFDDLHFDWNFWLTCIKMDLIDAGCIITFVSKHTFVVYNYHNRQTKRFILIIEIKMKKNYIRPLSPRASIFLELLWSAQVMEQSYNNNSHNRQKNRNCWLWSILFRFKYICLFLSWGYVKQPSKGKL